MGTDYTRGFSRTDELIRAIFGMDVGPTSYKTNDNYTGKLLGNGNW